MVYWRKFHHLLLVQVWQSDNWPDTRGRPKKDSFYLILALKIAIYYLLSPVDDILGEGEAAYTGPAHHAVVTRRGVRHLHGGELEKTFTQRHSAKQKLSVIWKEEMVKKHTSLVQSHLWQV